MSGAATVLAQLLAAVRQKCAECFQPPPRRQEVSALSQELIEIKPLPAEDKPMELSQVRAYEECRVVVLSPKGVGCGVGSSATTSLVGQGGTSSPGQLKEDEFQSIESYFSRETEGKSRRSFKLCSTLKKSRSLAPSIQQICVPKSVQSGEWNVTPDNNQRFILGEQVQKLKQWMRKEYGGERKGSGFRMSYAVRLRMQGQSMLTLLVHKLEDYRVFYLEESRSSTFAFSNRHATLSAAFSLTDLGSSAYRTGKIMAYYRLQTSTVHPQAVLRAFNSRQALRILHCFTQVSVVEREAGWSESLPVVEAVQSDRGLKRRSVLHLGRQLGEVQFSDEEGRQLVEAAFSLDEGEAGWQRIAKIFVSQKGHVEIYCESSEEMLCAAGTFFSQRWASLQRYLAGCQLVAA